MASKLADFFVDLKVQGDTVTLRTMVDSMADMKLETLGEIGALGALGLALKNAGLQAMSLSSGYTSINKEYGTNITMLQRWQNVARASNVPVEAVAQTFTQMQKLLASPFIGNPNSAFMRAAGIMGISGANRMTAEQLNEVLRVAVPNYIRRTAPTQGRENAITNAGSLLESLGATRSMIQMYTLPEARFQKEEGNAPIMSADDIKNWTELNAQVRVLGQVYFMELERVLAAALPGIISAGKAVLDFTIAVEGFLGNNFQKSGEAAAIPWGGGKTGSGDVVAHALMSWLVPAVVSANAGKQTVVHQSNDTDIHVYGDAGGGMPDQIMRNQERLNQHQMTRAMQTLREKVAY